MKDNLNSYHVGGSTSITTGDKIAETYLHPKVELASTKKGGSYADLTFELQDGTRVYVQTVDKGKVHGMSLREWDNANRIMRQDPDAIIITVQKGKKTFTWRFRCKKESYAKRKYLYTLIIYGKNNLFFWN